MGTPILAVISWPYLAILIIALIGMVAWFPFRRLAREGNVAWAEGDAALSLERAIRLYESNLLWAIIERVANPGHLQAVIASRHLAIGQASEAIDWCERGLAKARKPGTRILLHAVKAEALAVLNDLPALDHCLRQLEEVYVDGLVPGASWTVTAAVSHTEAGSPERSLAIIAEAAKQGRAAPSTMDFYAANHTLVSLGQWDAVLHLAHRVLPPNLSPEMGSKPPASGRASPDAVGADRVRENHESITDSHIVGCALAAAERLGRWDLYDSYLQILQRQSPGNLRLRATSHGYHAIGAAHHGDAYSVQQQLDELDALLETIPRDHSQRASCDVLAARALCLLGRYDQALARLTRASDAETSPLDRSLRAVRIAECLDALGRGQESEAYRAEARRLAPQAWWNHPDPSSIIDEQTAAIVNGWTQPADERSGRTQPRTVYSPVEQVASPLAWVVWILAVLTVFPAFGALASVPLLGCALALMTGQKRRPHDRRVGWAGIALATFSLASTAFLVYSYFAISARETALAASSETGSPRASSSETTSSYPDEMTSENDEEATTPAIDNEESGDAETDADSSARPDWSLSLTVAWRFKVLFLVVLILSIIPHEVGHGVAALWCGDPTARDRGRLNLNPIRHVSWFGSIFLPLLLILLPGAGVWIGWAKPVPVQFHRFRSPRLGQLAVSLSGVSMNLLLAAAAASVLTTTLALAKVCYDGGLASGFLDTSAPAEMAGVPVPAAWAWIIDFCRVTILANTLLAVFNLIPLPPLDGFHLIRSVVPPIIARFLSRLSFVGFTLFLVLVMTGYVGWMMIPAVYLMVPLVLPAYLLGLL